MVAASGVLLCGVSRAQSPTEPTYGRVSGDVCLVAGVGATIASRGPRAAGELRARYLDAAGVFATYEDSLSASGGSEPRRVLAGGLELRPLFLYRWLRGLESRRGHLDLTLDSIGLELGAFLAAPPGTPTTFRPGFQLGLGVEVPILAQATGVWLAFHGGVRWADQGRAPALASGPEGRAAYLTISLAWHQLIGTHMVDVADEPPQ